MSLSDAEIEKMCRNLSYKLASPYNREDLQQEGLLACYELLAQDKLTHPAELYRDAKRRMHNYTNLADLPVTLPVSTDVRDILLNGKANKINRYSDKNIENIKLLLSEVHVEYEEGMIASDDDHVKDYEDTEYADHVTGLALSTLTRSEWHVIKLKYYEGMTQEDISEGLSMSQQAVSLHEKSALYKLKGKLDKNCNISS